MHGTRYRSSTEEGVEAAKEFTESIVQFVREKNAELTGRDLGWFINMTKGGEKPEDVFGAHLPRLRRAKAKYDPKKVFSKGAVIEPLFE